MVLLGCERIVQSRYLWRINRAGVQVCVHHDIPASKRLNQFHAVGFFDDIDAAVGQQVRCTVIPIAVLRPLDQCLNAGSDPGRQVC